MAALTSCVPAGTFHANLHDGRIEMWEAPVDLEKLSFYLKSHNVKHVTVHQLDTCHKKHLPKGLWRAVSQTLRFFFPLFAVRTAL